MAMYLDRQFEAWLSRVCLSVLSSHDIIHLTYLVAESNGIIRLHKATAAHKDCFASLRCLYDTSSIGLAISHSLYVVNYWHLYTASQDKVGMKRLGRVQRISMCKIHDR